ncbi:XRE family transcriptional regulator [Pandoraea anapnoica]|uniref:XRE family transcriptional regulator n=1 Tax=Pandoraea anapnoica TaxID=2508301 RepID=A0A5E4ZYQ1_9BURK|nr:helix-turn-helix transcriptional regulator [Pandoraea anapnoica]VVE65405.1 XRE family transcriptional regulator [Pandoraea anapnoica]VVE65422.1 XRE family transcriptional regulator [Pandoraea anapnoica]
MESFGMRLKAERERIGLSQAAFAEACGVGKTAQYTYERGEREPSWTYMEAAEKLGVDSLYVFSGTRKGEDWAYARAYQRMLHTIEMMLGLDETRLERIAQMVIANEAALEGGAITVDTGPYNEAILDWLRTSATPDRFLDIDLLATIIARLDVTATRLGKSLTPEKKAMSIAMLYRAFKASGKTDEALIADAITLAAK